LSTNWTLNVEPAPAILVLPPDAASLDEAHAAIELWEHYSRKTLDPTQRLAVEVMMAETADHRWAAQTTGREMARQNGKGDEIEVVEFWGIVQRAEAILHTIHDAVLLATETQARMLMVLDHKDLRSKIKRKWTGTGQQMIEMRNGGQIWYRTRTGGGGRGTDDIDRVVVDEAQHATAEQLAAMTPTLFANANPQLNMIGTAALPKISKPWWAVRKRALLADPGPFGYVGHTAETLSLSPNGDVVSVVPLDFTDESVWIATNPAVTHRPAGKIEFLREQYYLLGPIGFGQEHLCIWAVEPGTDGEAGPIDLDMFASLGRVNVEYDHSTVSLACVVAYDRSWTSIVAVGLAPDGFEQAKLVATRPGTQWAAERVRELCQELGGKPVAMVKDEPLIDDMIALGVTVVPVSGADQAKSSQKLIDACSGEAPTLRHRGEPALTKALELAATKPYGDGNTDFSSRASNGDISPLKALTLAYGRLGAEQALGDPLAAILA